VFKNVLRKRVKTRHTESLSRVVMLTSIFRCLNTENYHVKVICVNDLPWIMFVLEYIGRLVDNPGPRDVAGF
jgi:hypothetical protein